MPFTSLFHSRNLSIKPTAIFRTCFLDSLNAITWSKGALVFQSAANSYLMVPMTSIFRANHVRISLTVHVFLFLVLLRARRFVAISDLQISNTEDADFMRNNITESFCRGFFIHSNKTKIARDNDENKYLDILIPF